MEQDPIRPGENNSLPVPPEKAVKLKKIIYEGPGRAFAVIDDQKYPVELFGTPVGEIAPFLCMNVHFWMLRQGFQDETENGENQSAVCPIEKNISA